MSLGILVGKSPMQKDEIAAAVVEAFAAKDRLVHRANPDEASLWRWDRWGLGRYLEQAIAKLCWARVGHGPAN